MGDYIKHLPTDSSNLPNDQQTIIHTLFKDNNSNVSKLVTGLKDTLLVGGLYALFSLQPTSNLIERLTGKTGMYLLLFKTLIVMLCYFIVTNLFLAFKCNDN